MVLKFLPWIFAICYCCPNISPENSIIKQTTYQVQVNENPYKKIVEIPMPAGFLRTVKGHGSFAEWLEKVNLKKNKTVYTFNSTPKNNQTAQFAVLDISVGNKDLQQCADAVMRLRAEYFYEQKNYDKIIFTDNNGTPYQYHEPYTRQNFDRYLERVFGRCGSASSAKQLSRHIEIKDVEPGDVLIRGGFPGHAVIVMDVAVNKDGKKLYLLAQSYMPAQDIHVLVNPVNKELSPWYEVNNETIIETPEYTFSRYELKRW